MVKLQYGMVKPMIYKVLQEKILVEMLKIRYVLRLLGRQDALINPRKKFKAELLYKVQVHLILVQMQLNNSKKIGEMLYFM